MQVSTEGLPAMQTKIVDSSCLVLPFSNFTGFSRSTVWALFQAGSVQKNACFGVVLSDVCNRTARFIGQN